MERPWMKLWTRDWLDSKELRRCSPLARAVLADLMCLANEGQPHGYLADKIGQLTLQFMASRCVISAAQFTRAVAELIGHGRLYRDGAGVLFIQRMVEDEALRIKMAEGGRKGGNPNLVKRMVASEVNLKVNLIDKHARARADSDSVSVSSFPKKGGMGENGNLTDSFSELVDRMYGRHPKTGNLPLVPDALECALKTHTAQQIEDCHAAWCESAKWKAEPQFVNQLATWLADRGYTKWPAGKEPAKPLPKLTPYDPIGDARREREARENPITPGS